MGDKDRIYKFEKIFTKRWIYIRIAPEVYMRIVQNRKTAEKHYKRIDEVAPKSEIVRLLRLTEKQYKYTYGNWK